MLFNCESVYSLRLARGLQEGYAHDRACSHISLEEVKDTLRRMKSRKAISPDFIHVEI